MGAFLEGGQMILVTEYMVGGDLYDVIGHDLNQTFSWYQRWEQVSLNTDSYVRCLLQYSKL